MDVMMKKIRDSILFILLIGLDQGTKYLAQNALQDGKVIEIIPKVFQLRYLENRGAAFGIFKGQMWFIIALTGIALLFFIFLYVKLPENKRYTPLRYILIVIAAGAVGNCIDRFAHSYVIDFLYFILIDFPIFNVADCYVTIGTFFAFLLLIFYYKEEEFTFLSPRKKEQESK